MNKKKIFIFLLTSWVGTISIGASSTTAPSILFAPKGNMYTVQFEARCRMLIIQISLHYFALWQSRHVHLVVCHILESVECRYSELNYTKRTSNNLATSPWLEKCEETSTLNFDNGTSIWRTWRCWLIRETIQKLKYIITENYLTSFLNFNIPKHYILVLTWSGDNYSYLKIVVIFLVLRTVESRQLVKARFN